MTTSQLVYLVGFIVLGILLVGVLFRFLMTFSKFCENLASFLREICPDVDFSAQFFLLTEKPHAFRTFWRDRGIIPANEKQVVESQPKPPPLRPKPMNDLQMEFDVEAYLRARANPTALIELAKGKTLTLDGFGDLDGLVMDTEKYVAIQAFFDVLLLNTFVGLPPEKKKECSDYYLQFFKPKRPALPRPESTSSSGTTLGDLLNWKRAERTKDDDYTEPRVRPAPLPQKVVPPAKEVPPMHNPKDIVL